MSLRPGDQIHGFQVVALIGAGGMGEVYRARDSRVGRDVAVKVLPAAFAADPGRVARLEREARLLGALNHPHIATLYGLEHHGGQVTLVMELVEGETLDHRIRRHGASTPGLPVPEAIDLARQLVDALDAAHERGIVHRDLKPLNIKVTPDGTLKVLDFGLAKAVRADAGQDVTFTVDPVATQAHAVVGTAAYMSPEQARGLPVDRRTDVWAFGCVLYEMLTGHPVFKGETASDTIAAVLGHTVDWSRLPAGVPSGLRRLLERCLDRQPKTRLRDIGDARPYFDEAPTAPAAGLAPGDRGGISRRALLASGAAMGLLGAGLGAAFTALRPAPTPVLPSFQRLTFRRGMIRTARFAPDFQTVLYGALWDGDDCRTYTVRPESPESSPLALPPATPLAISGSGELALALGSHQRGIMTYGTLARVPLAGGAPREVQERVKYADWSPDGRELAIVRGDGMRDVLEFPIGTAIAQATVETGGFSFPRVSPRGDRVAVFELELAAGLTGKVVIVDRAGKRLGESVDYFNVFGLAWHGDEVWFTAADELPLLRNTVHAMDASGRVRVVARVPGNTSLHDLTPDGRALIARTDDRGGLSVRVPGATSERDFSWLDAANFADLSRDGQRVLFYEQGVGGGPFGAVYLRHIDGSTPVRLGEGRAFSLSPDGRRVIAFTRPPGLDIIPTGTGSVQRLERAGLRLSVGRWLPDSRHAVVRARVADTAPSRLYRVDVDGTDVTPITPEGLVVGFGGWWPSPDGRFVAISTTRGPELFPIAGGAATAVPDADPRWQVIGWIDRGLLVCDDLLAARDISVVDPSSGRREPWAQIAPRDPAGIMSLELTFFAATPDGRAFGYTWHRATSDLFLVKDWV